ncbi:MAG: MarR family transcriptional regulator [Pseudomonadota bacterium]
MPEENNPPHDLVALLRQQWQQERPDLDTGAMEVVGRIAQIASRWDAELRETLKPFQLSYTDFDILATLRRSGAPFELTPTALLESVLLTSGALTTAMKRLERSGYLTRIDDPADRRSRRARLTDQGIALAEEAAAVRFRVAAEQLGTMDESDRSELIRLLQQLA